MTTETAQRDSHLEVPGSEVQQAQRITMNRKLLEASTGHIAIPVQQNPTTQEDSSSCLLGVTIGGNTALHIAASEGNLALVENICRREISLLAAPNTRLDTPLHCAARAGDDRMVSRLIQLAKEKGIEASRVLKMRNWEDGNALHEAAKYNHVRVAQVLLQEDAELACMLDGAGISPLYLAIMTGSLDVAKALLRCSSRYLDSPKLYAGPRGETALHAAVFLSPDAPDHHNMPKQLLEHNGSIVYKSDGYGLFPIHVAAIRGKMAIVDQILQNCQDAHELLDGEGKNFLHVALQWKNLDMVKETISKRPHLKKLLNDQDNKGNTPLHTAIQNMDQHSVHFLLRDKSINLNIVNYNGSTPLDLACAKMDHGLTFRWNASFCIVSSLALREAKFGLPRLNVQTKVKSSSYGTKDDNMVEERFFREDREINKAMELSKSFGLFSVLIATIAFAAAFTLPGGYVADDHSGHGTAVLVKEYPFRVFLVSNAFALVCSLIATSWLMYAGISIVDADTRRRILVAAIDSLWLAFVGISTAFAMGIYVVLPPSCKGLGILLCFFAIGAPVLDDVVKYRNFFSVLKTIGAKRLIYPTIHPFVKERLHLSVMREVLIVLLMRCGSYALFFLLPMIYVSKD